MREKNDENRYVLYNISHEVYIKQQREDTKGWDKNKNFKLEDTSE